VQSDDGSEELEEVGVAWKKVRGNKKFNLILRKKLKTQRLVTLFFCFHSLYFVALQL
jgi:hypothetical protein